MSYSFAQFREHLKHYWLVWVVIIFVAALLIGYAAGFRPGPGLTVVRVGTVVVAGIPDGTTVYADLAPRGTSKGGSLSAHLVPGTHSIIVDAPGDEPWQQIITITSNKDTEIFPILVPKQPIANELAGSSGTDALNFIAASKLPSEKTPLRMGCSYVFASMNRVIVAPLSDESGCVTPEFLCSDDACAPTIAYSPAAELRSIIPFPGRTDAVIVATGAWVYAIALDPRTPQFFAPVMHGVAPTLATTTGTSFYVADQAKAYLVSF